MSSTSTNTEYLTPECYNLCFDLSKMIWKTHEKDKSFYVLILLGYLYFCYISMGVFTHCDVLFFLSEVPHFLLSFPLPMGKFLYHSLQVGFLAAISDSFPCLKCLFPPPFCIHEAISLGENSHFPVTSREPKDTVALPSVLWKPGTATTNHGHVMSRVLTSLPVASSCACVWCAVEGRVGVVVVTGRTWKGRDNSTLAGTVILSFVSLTDLEVEVCSSPQDVSDSNEFLNRRRERPFHLLMTS